MRNWYIYQERCESYPMPEGWSKVRFQHYPTSNVVQLSADTPAGTSVMTQLKATASTPKVAHVIKDMISQYERSLARNQINKDEE